MILCKNELLRIWLARVLTSIGCFIAALATVLCDEMKELKGRLISA